MEQATFRELILRDVDAKDAEDAIRQVGQRFYAEGFVKDTYIDAVVAREKAYATGLQLEEIAVAMPHTDPRHVNRPGVCIAQLKHPVTFEHMGDPDTKVEASPNSTGGRLHHELRYHVPSADCRSVLCVLVQKSDYNRRNRCVVLCNVLCV